MPAWYKRFPRDALNGMRGLNEAERAFYGTVLDLIYEGDGPVADIAMTSEMGCQRRRWHTVRDALVTKGKLVVLPDGRVTNTRAQAELRAYRDRSHERSGAGRKGGKIAAAKRAAEPDLFGANDDGNANEINGRPQAQLDEGRERPRTPSREPERTANGRQMGGKHVENREKTHRFQGVSEPFDGDFPNEINGGAQAEPFHVRAQEPEPEVEEEETPLGPLGDDDDEAEDEPATRRKPKRRLPTNWQPPQLTEFVANATAHWQPERITHEAEQFRNHAHSTDRRLADWDRGFLNWLLKAAEFDANRRTRHGADPSESGWTSTIRARNNPIH
jgi:hypothetical protein